MRTPGFPCCLAGLLLAAPALAQPAPKAPPTLLGRWATRRIHFALAHPVADSVLARLEDPNFLDLSGALALGTTYVVELYRRGYPYISSFKFARQAQLVVEFRADSSYTFTIERAGQVLRTEVGTYSLRGNHLLASAPASPDGSSFNDQQVQRLTRSDLVLRFPMGPELPGVAEEVEYGRVGPGPASAGAK